MSLSFILYTVASVEGLGAVLSQEVKGAEHDVTLFYPCIVWAGEELLRDAAQAVSSS